MEKENFNQIDASISEDLKPLREKKVPSAILKGFSASVMAKIHEKEAPKESPEFFRKIWVPAWAPVLAVLVIAVVVVSRPTFGPVSSPEAVSTVEVASVNADEMATEIEAMRELGVWTDEDENGLSDLQFSEVIAPHKIVFA